MNRIFLLLFFIAVSSAQSCLSSADRLINKRCFTFVNQQLNYRDARDWCHFRNPVTFSYLATVPDTTTANFLASYARTIFNSNDGSFWIGLSRYNTSSRFQWDDGTPVSWTNFQLQNAQNYVAESITNAKFSTYAGDNKYNFICSYDPNGSHTGRPTYQPDTTTAYWVPTAETDKPPGPTPTESQCSPTDPRTILFAYSTDLNYTIIENAFNQMLYFTKIQNLWRTYANIRFDTRNEEQIAYHYDFPSFNASILSHKPDPSLGYQDSTTGSDVLKVIKKFLETSPSLCGSSVFIVAKRYPNDAPQLEGLISELRNNHIFVYIIADSEPTGGTNSAALFEISSRTNGFCIFGPYDYTSYDIYLSSIAFITRPYQVASKNVRVSGSGSQTLSVKVYGEYPTQQLGMIITFLGHPRDGSLKSLNYTLTDPNGEVNTSGPFQSVLQRKDTLCYEFPVVNNTMEYTLTVNYEYEKDREGVLEMRFYSGDYQIGYWLPFDN